MAYWADSLKYELEVFIEPLLLAAQHELVRTWLLLEIPAWKRLLADAQAVGDALATLSENLTGAVETVIDLLESLDDMTIEDIVRALEQVGDLFKAPAEILGALMALFNPPPSDSELVAGLFDLLNLLFGIWLERRAPVLVRILELLTLSRPVQGTSTVPVATALDLDRFVDFFSDPVGLLREEYSPYDSEDVASGEQVAVVSSRLFPRLASLLRALDVPARSAPQSRARTVTFDGATLQTIPSSWCLFVDMVDWTGPDEQATSIEIVLTPTLNSGNPPPLVPTLLISVDGSFNSKIPLDDWLLSFTASSTIPVFAVDTNADFITPTSLSPSDVALTASTSLGRLDPADPLLLGPKTGLHLLVGHFNVSSKLVVSDAINEVACRVELGNPDLPCVLVLAASDADSFLQGVLPAGGLDVAFSFCLELSSAKGLHLDGGVGLDLTIPLNKDLSIAYLHSISLHLGVHEAEADIFLWAGVDVSVNLGIADIAVEGVGVRLKSSFGGEGNLGAFDLRLGFKPPTGLGLSIDAAGVTGGGFIQFDEERGQYAGLLALQLADLCDITAIALLDTKLPDGASGWSFLGLLFAEFSPGLQVGAGFTLLGVGGLFGFNRELDTDALLAMYAAGRVGALMFPEDPVANAPQLIADLRGVFPAAPGRVVFGPFVKMGFGTPTVVEAELGVLISLPDPVVISLLGELSIYLPARDAPIAELHVDVLGLLDLGKKVFFLGGTLRDSRVLFFKLSGGMAFWLSWGQGTDFAFSIGGFHPAFTPPPDLLVPPRLTCSMGFGDYARLEMRQYLAITPNTFQIGSYVELNAGLCGFSVRAWAGYDALLYFKPLRFQVDFTAGVEVRCGGRTLASLEIDGHMTGPNPFHLWGKIRISLLFFDIKIPINLSFGERQREELPARTPLDALVASLSDEANWSTGGSAGGVVLDLARAQDEAPILDPSGAVRFLQREVPLERPVERFEQADLDVPVTLSVTLGGVTSQLIDEPMPPASWRKLTDAQRLSLPRPFEPTPAGLRFTQDTQTFGGPVPLTLTWDESVTDEPNQPQPPPKGRALKVAPLGVRLPADWLVQETP